MSGKLVAVPIIVFISLFLLAATTPPHLDRRLMRYGCGTCHAGNAFNGGGASEGCLQCHGTQGTGPSALMIGEGAPVAVADEFRKPYRHPTFDVRGVHSSKEVLPESDPRSIRHADCVDCHHPHLVSSARKYAGIPGKRVGNLTAEVIFEYELCYRCHGDSANLPPRAGNKRAEFARSNASFHPVEGEGKNLAVVSLLRPYREQQQNPNDVSTITCGDCHGSDNPASPKGPHGSNYQYLLVDSFSTKDREPETPQTYALCYRCHSRSSILANESFRFHAQHVQGSSGVEANGTSCFTCHNSHGSQENRYLIRFNLDVVTPNSRGMLKFVEKGVSKFSGDCYLSCHGVDHDPKSY